MFGPDDASPQGFKSAIWDPVADRSVLALDGDFVDSGWVGRDRIAEVADDGSVSIVGVPNGTAERIDVTVETDWANLTFLPSGFVAAGYADGRVVLQGIDDGSSVTMQLTNPSGTFQPMANSIALSPDLTTVYVGAQGAWAFDRTTGRQVAANDDTQIGLVATRPTGRSRRRCSTARSNCSITSLRVIVSVPGARGFVSDLRFSSDGELLAGLGERRHRVAVQRGNTRAHR